MELLERYLQAVEEHLPAKGRQDTLAELRANLQAELDEREEMAGRPLTEAEVGSVLEAHGMPLCVAARYQPQRTLIGPEMFPVYWYTLKRSFPFVVLAYAVVLIARFAIGGEALSRLPAAVWGFSGIALTFWAIMTLGFAVFDYVQQNYGSKGQPRWSVRELPKLQKRQPGETHPSLASGIADLIVSVLGVIWLLLVPAHPYLMFGPGAKLMRMMPFDLTPEWRVYFWMIIGLLVAMWPLKLMMMLPRFARWRQSLDVAVHLLGIGVLVVMVQVKSYFVPVAAMTTQNPLNLQPINLALGIGFKVALAVSVVKLLWDIWKMMSGSRQRQPGCATVL